MAASSSSSSSSEGEGEGSKFGMLAARRKGRPLPKMSALARLARAAPHASADAQAAAALAAAQRPSASSPAAPSASAPVKGATSASAHADSSAGSSRISPAAAEPELAAGLRLRDTGDAHPSAGAALLSAATSSAATSPASGCAADQQRDVDAFSSNIVAAPQQAAMRVNVCQGKSCAKRGAAELLRQASAAGGGRPGLQVSACKCLGECKRGPAVRVRTGRERPTVLTKVHLWLVVFAGLLHEPLQVFLVGHHAADALLAAREHSECMMVLCCHRKISVSVKIALP